MWRQKYRSLIVLNSLKPLFLRIDYDFLYDQLVLPSINKPWMNKYIFPPLFNYNSQLQKNKCLNEERKARLEKEKKQKEEETKAHIPPSIRKLAKERQIASQDSSSKKVSSMDSTEQMKPLERRVFALYIENSFISSLLLIVLHFLVFLYFPSFFSILFSQLPPKVQINSTYTNTFTPIGSDANKKPKATNAVSLAPEKKSSPRDEDEDVPMIDIQEEEQKEYDQTEQDTMKAAQLMDQTKLSNLCKF